MDYAGAAHSIALLLALILSVGETSQHSPGNSNKLLLIVLDGYRWDYPTRSYPGFNHLRMNGVEAAYLQPSFPTLTMPNLQSIMTGLYPESHGMTGDYMYDVVTNTSFTRMENSIVDSEAHWWNTADPIWTSATRQDRRVYMYHWPGCDVYIHGIKPHMSLCKPLHNWQVDKAEFRHAANEAIRLFATDTADFISIFHSEPDSSGHEHGSGRMNNGIKNSISVIDDVLAGIQRQLDDKTYMQSDLKLSDMTDLMVVSTHGMSNISPTRIVNLTDAFNMSDIQHIVTGYTMVQLWPEDGKLEKVMGDIKDKLRYAKLYRREDFPQHLHYGKGQFVAPLIILADDGFTLLTIGKHSNFPTVNYGSNRPWAGNHGYSLSNSDMRGIFAAKGPHFKKGLNTTGIENVCLYQIMCSILGIESNQHNCSWGSIEDKVVGLVSPNVYQYPSHVPKIVIALIALALIFALTSAICGLYCQREKIKKRFGHRGVEWQPLHDGVL